MKRVAISLALSLAAAAAIAASSDAAQTAPSATAKPSTLPSDDVVGFRLPLLREGSVISRVVGDLTLDPDEKHWIFRPIQPESGNLRREFILLPSEVLEDMLRTRRLSPSPVEFEVTGRVFIYKGRNHLLAELAPPIVRFDTRPTDTPSPATKVETSPNGASKFVAPSDPSTQGSAKRGPTKPDSTKPEPTKPVDRDGDATIEDIERRLEQRVGRTSVARSATDDEAPAAEAGSTARSASEADLKMFKSGERLVLRKGRLTRDPQAGSWRFSPEQVTGRGDRSLEILPCLLLERLERITREGDSSPSILLSGTVVVFEGNSYLLPTNFRRAREGRGIGR